MSYCVAPNCTNNSRKKSKLWRFPADIERRKKWTANLGRKGWFPGPKAVLCSAHFEESQFELSSTKNVKRLKRNAIPTIFNVQNTPTVLTSRQIKQEGCPWPESVSHSVPVGHLQEDNQQSENELTRKIAVLEKENESLRKAIREKDKVLLSFLSEEQITSLYVDRKSIAHWNHESITKALKMRLNLGKKGYNYLRQTGYPLPSWSTINSRMRKMKLDVSLNNGKNNIDKDDIDKIVIDKIDIDENDIDEDDTDEDNNDDDIDENIYEDDISENS